MQQNAACVDKQRQSLCTVRRGSGLVSLVVDAQDAIAPTTLWTPSTLQRLHVERLTGAGKS